MAVMRAIAWVLIALLVGCGSGWGEVRPTSIDAKPYRPQTIFIVTPSDAFVMHATEASAGQVRGHLIRAWKIQPGRFLVAKGDTPDDVAARNGWVERQPEQGFRAIAIANITYAANEDEMTGQGDSGVVLLICAIVLGLGAAVYVVGNGAYK
jgi:hypothetical protein